MRVLQWFSQVSVGQNQPLFTFIPLTDQYISMGCFQQLIALLEGVSAHFWNGYYTILKEMRGREIFNLPASQQLLNQEIIKVREWIPHIGPLTKVIRLKLFLDIVPNSSEDITRAMRGQPKRVSRITWEKWRERHFICFGFVSYRRCFLHSQPSFLCSWAFRLFFCSFGCSLFCRLFGFRELN